jgi:hypothetical protein
MWTLDCLMGEWRSSGTLSRRKKACLIQRLDQLKRRLSADEIAAMDWACGRVA